MFKHTILKPRFKPSVGFVGRYRFEVRNAYTHEIVRETDWSDNLILDTGLNRIGNAASGVIIDRIVIGTGTTAPSVGDTALSALSASTLITTPGHGAVSNSGSPNYINRYVNVYRFNAGVLNGNYTEVGAGWANTGLWSRALIVDGSGNPTTITVGATEYLDVFYEIRGIPDLSTYTNSVTLRGTTYSVQRKPAGVNNTSVWRFSNAQMNVGGAQVGLTGYPLTVYTGTMGAVTGTPSGTVGIFSTPAVMSAYSNNSFQRLATFSVGLNDCNVPGGFRSMVIGTGYSAWQFEFDTPVGKTSDDIMTLNLAGSWGRL